MGEAPYPRYARVLLLHEPHKLLHFVFSVRNEGDDVAEVQAEFSQRALDLRQKLHGCTPPYHPLEPEDDTARLEVFVDEVRSKRHEAVASAVGPGVGADGVRYKSRLRLRWLCWSWRLGMIVRDSESESHHNLASCGQRHPSV